MFVLARPGPTGVGVQEQVVLPLQCRVQKLGVFFLPTRRETFGRCTLLQLAQIMFIVWESQEPPAVSGSRSCIVGPCLPFLYYLCGRFSNTKVIFPSSRTMNRNLYSFLHAFRAGHGTFRNIPWKGRPRNALFMFIERHGCDLYGLRPPRQQCW